MKCLSTRRTPEGLKRRRYEQPDGTRHTTIEVPVTVWNALNRQGRAADRLRQFTRVCARQSLRQAVVGRTLAGWKPLAVAHDLGVPLRTVQRWGRAAGEKKYHKDVDSKTSQC